MKNRKSLTAQSYPARLGIGFLTNFFDTLGIGSFAQQSALFKLLKLVDDKLIPGTMNVENTLSTVTQAFIFMSVVEIGKTTLISMLRSVYSKALQF